LRLVARCRAHVRWVSRVRRAAEAGTLWVDALGPGTLDVRGPLVLRRLLLLAHASRFLPRRDSWSWVGACSSVGTASRAAFSAARAAATRLTPRGVFWTCSCSVRIESS